MKNRIEVSCPHCHSHQIEPSLAVSTFCRACGQHFKIAKKVEKRRFGFLRPNVEEDAVAVPEKRISPHELRARPLPEKEPAMAVPAVAGGVAVSAVPGVDRAAAVPAPVREEPVFPRSLDEIMERGSGRQVLCFECPEVHEVPSGARSTICPACSTHINLESTEVRDHSSQRIQTRGDVTIHKNGSHVGAELRCHDLFVEGQVSGTLDASGTITFRRDCRVRGGVRCGRLVVDRKVTLEFEKPVLVGGGADVSGNVTGDIECGGSMKLHKNACLDGSLRATGIAVDPGAELLAETEIVRRG